MKEIKQTLYNHLKTSVLVFISILLLSGVSTRAATPMPSFKLSDARSGKSVASQEFQGKALLVTFFATWCAPCIKEVPNLIQLQSEFGKKDFSVLALSVDQGGPRVVKKLIDKYSINYPVLMASAATGRDFGGVRSIPASFLINKSGNVVKRYRLGYIPHSEFESDIKRVLN